MGQGDKQELCGTVSQPQITALLSQHVPFLDARCRPLTSSEVMHMSTPLLGFGKGWVPGPGRPPTPQACGQPPQRDKMAASPGRGVALLSRDLSLAGGRPRAREGVARLNGVTWQRGAEEQGRARVRRARRARHTSRPKERGMKPPQLCGSVCTEVPSWLWLWSVTLEACPHGTSGEIPSSVGGGHSAQHIGQQYQQPNKFPM